MKANGSAYVAVVLAALTAYASYQWWFNPTRAVSRRLGEVAAALSVPPGETELARASRTARLSRYLADDVRVSAGGGPALASRDAVLATVASLRAAPDGVDVQFVDVQVAVDSGASARAFMSVELTTHDPATGQPTVDTRDATVTLAKRNGEWVVTSAESTPPPRL